MREVLSTANLGTKNKMVQRKARRMVRSRRKAATIVRTIPIEMDSAREGEEREGGIELHRRERKTKKVVRL